MSKSHIIFIINIIIITNIINSKTDIINLIVLLLSLYFFIIKTFFKWI